MAAQPRRRFCREALEASVSALVVALLLKAFVVEAYRIPTGSMQPTLYGHEFGDGNALEDTVLVDRLAYLHGEPRRFDVAVFRFPLDRSRSFVKRIWGLPGETLRIADGDVQRLEPDGVWRALQRPDDVRRAMWLELDHSAGWDLEHATAIAPRRGAVDGRVAPLEVALAPPPGLEARLTFPRGAGDAAPELGIVDRYRDGYPAPMRARLAESGGQHVVGDLRVEVDVLVPTDDSSLHWLTLQLRERGENGWQYTVARLRVRGRSEGDGMRELTVYVEPDAPTPEPMHGPLQGEQKGPFTGLIDGGLIDAGVRTRVVLEVCDDIARLSLEAGGRRTSTYAPVAAMDPLASSVHITADGRVDLSVALARDVHYVLGGRAATDTWTIPAEHYFVLGDNTQRSVDSREWRLVAYRYEAGPRAGEVVLGQSVPGENPLTSLNEGDQPVWYFRDQWGERQRLPTDEVGMPPPSEAPFVPRDHLVGRVFVALWPLHGGLGRPSWVH